MANTYLLSDPSKRYLCCYYQILDEMIQGITTAKLTRSLSHNFIVQMIPHHQAAVRMCRNLLQYSDDGAVRRLAQRITDQQTQGLQAMEGLLADCGQPANPQMDLRLCHRRTELILRELFSQMGSAPEGNRLDLVFLRQMIPHHLGAARMAQNTLRYQVATGLAPVLRSTIDTHCKEVRQMRALLRRMGCQTV
ncbi:MAG: DUF305 domain-containing protein [Oscillospiraceae bacterium]|jgi:uncharacterized protein (DUF305 family)|nr:DUF305 domain-containing protein [Oscillospiraceae bacterium]